MILTVETEGNKLVGEFEMRETGEIKKASKIDALWSGLDSNILATSYIIQIISSSGHFRDDNWDIFKMKCFAGFWKSDDAAKVLNIKNTYGSVNINLPDFIHF